jgi:CheY-like chemotaxis protein
LLIAGALGGALRCASGGLARTGYGVERTKTRSDAAVRAALQPPDALILEVDLPDGSAIDLCREIRGWSDAAILLAAKSGDERGIVAGLDAGADDVLKLPIGLDELCARLRAALRRAAGAVEEIVTVGDLTIDLEKDRLPGRRACPSDTDTVQDPPPPRAASGQAAAVQHAAKRTPAPGRGTPPESILLASR